MRVCELVTERVEFPCGKRKWPVVFTYRALAECERISGVDILAETLAKPSSRLMRALLFGAMAGAGAQLVIEDVGRAIGRIGVDAARQIVMAAWIASMPEPEALERRESSGGTLRWLDIWASARASHGLPQDEWLDMTPRMFHELEKLRLDQMRREELLIGIVASTQANFSMCAPKQPISAEAFMLHKIPKSEERDPGPVTGDFIMAEMRKLTTGRNGTL